MNFTLYTGYVYRNLFRAFILTKLVLETLFSVTTKVTGRLLTAVRPREYVFFSGYTTPFLSHMVNHVGSGIPSIDWIYNLDTNILRKENERGTPENISWLAASIVFNGMKLYSLDDFISEIKFINSKDEEPSPAIIVGTWMLMTGNVLNNKINLELHVVNQEGTVVVYSPWPELLTTINNNNNNNKMNTNNLYIESTLFGRTVSTSRPDYVDVSQEVLYPPLPSLLPLDDDDMPGLT